MENTRLRLHWDMGECSRNEIRSNLHPNHFCLKHTDVDQLDDSQFDDVSEAMFPIDFVACWKMGYGSKATNW